MPDFQGPPIARNMNAEQLVRRAEHTAYNHEKAYGQRVQFATHVVVRKHTQMDHSNLNLPPLHIPYTTANRYGSGSL